MTTGHLTAVVLAEFMVRRRLEGRGDMSLERANSAFSRLEDDPRGAGLSAGPQDLGRGVENCGWLAAVGAHAAARLQQAGTPGPFTFTTRRTESSTFNYWFAVVSCSDAAVTALAVADLIECRSDRLVQWYLETTTCGPTCLYHYPDAEGEHSRVGTGKPAPPDWAAMPSPTCIDGLSVPGRHAAPATSTVSVGRSARPRRTPATTPVRVVTPSRPREARSCPCGWHRATDHRERHAEWLCGRALTASLSREWPQDDTIVIVSATAGAKWRRMAYGMARLAQRDGRYDTPSWPFPDGPGRPDEYERTALLYRRLGRVVGYLVVTRGLTIGRFDLGSGRVDTADAATRRLSIDLIFVAVGFRRTGIAHALVRAVAADVGIDVCALAWSRPFSSEGRALAAHVAGDDNTVWVT